MAKRSGSRLNAARERAAAIAASVTQRQVVSFRLNRQHLTGRSPRGSMLRVLADIAGAQAQVVSAARLSLWARVQDLAVDEIDDAVARDRTVVKAACMRRTLHLLPSAEVAMYVRGSAKRAEMNARWLLNRGASPEELERVMHAVLDAFSVPRTRPEMMEAVIADLGRKVVRSADGWWGSTRKQPAIRIGPIVCPPNYLLSMVGAWGMVCYGESRGQEPTFVRADAWLPVVADLSVEAAEAALLRRYLSAYGPATPADFSAWTGMRRADAASVWKRIETELVTVEVDGRHASILAGDVDELRASDIAGPEVRLLPNFDAYLLAHAERSFVSADRRGAVFNKQGWVSAVLLVNGEARGTWSYKAAASQVTVDIAPFAPLSRAEKKLVRAEAERLARFLDRANAEVRFKA